MKKIVLALLSLTLLLAATVFIVGCSKGKSYGNAIPEETKPTPISSVLKNQQRYTKEEVVIEGSITSICPTGGWFYLRDSTGEIYVNNHPTFIFITPKTGGKVKVMGKLVPSDHGVDFVGTGVNVK